MKKILYWLIVALTLYGVAVTIIFGAIALINPGLISPDKTMNIASLFYAHHFAGRNFVFAILMLLPLILKDNKFLGIVLLLRGLMEGYDSVLSFIETNTVYPGLMYLIFAVIFSLSGMYILNFIKYERNSTK